MQENDTEIMNEQRRRHSRVAKMKNAIISLLFGWVVVSLLLISYLFMTLFQIQGQVDDLKAELEVISVGLLSNGMNNVGEGVQLYSDAKDYEPAIPVASGISEEENLAEENDIHKVYLTFEDGPSEHTAEILDVLKEKGVRATFFVTGQEGEAANGLYKRIVEEGHTLGMHSYSNKYSVIYQSEESFREDIVKLSAYLMGITGVEPRYYRFMGGSGNQITNVPMENFIHYLNQAGLVYYDWNISLNDMTENEDIIDETVAQVTRDVVKYKTSVVLMHDANDTAVSAEVLEAVIDALFEVGAEILPIDEDTAVIQDVKAATIE
ncbi:MAG: polysaccharide deacetylase [Lachnospiraceae bacterium]|nr:polysaccharide deacetylase [Lachnospiraceae bacterium]